jgi:hypothetical protein
MNRRTHFVCGWKLSSNFGRTILGKSSRVTRRSQLIFWHWQRIFLFSESSRPALGHNQPSIQWGTGVQHPGVQRPGMQPTTHLHIMPRLRMRYYTSTSHIPLCREQVQLYLAFMQWDSGSHAIARSTWILTLTFSFPGCEAVHVKLSVSRPWR